MTTQNPFHWHFIHEDSEGVPRLGYGDGREVKLKERLVCGERPVVLCEYGLHASPNLVDALKYVIGTGFRVCRVELETMITFGDDKCVSHARTVLGWLSVADTERLLLEWGRWVALQVADLWEMPALVRLYLETGNERLRDEALLAVRDYEHKNEDYDTYSRAMEAAGAAFSVCRAHDVSVLWVRDALIQAVRAATKEEYDMTVSAMKAAEARWHKKKEFSDEIEKRVRQLIKEQAT